MCLGKIDIALSVPRFSILTFNSLPCSSALKFSHTYWHICKQIITINHVEWLVHNPPFLWSTSLDSDDIRSESRDRRVASLINSSGDWYSSFKWARSSSSYSIGVNRDILSYFSVTHFLGVQFLNHVYHSVQPLHYCCRHRANWWWLHLIPHRFECHGTS